MELCKEKDGSRIDLKQVADGDRDAFFTALAHRSLSLPSLSSVPQGREEWSGREAMALRVINGVRAEEMSPNHRVFNTQPGKICIGTWCF